MIADVVDCREVENVKSPTRNIDHKSFGDIRLSVCGPLANQITSLVLRPWHLSSGRLEHISSMNHDYDHRRMSYNGMLLYNSVLIIIICYCLCLYIKTGSMSLIP